MSQIARLELSPLKIHLSLLMDNEVYITQNWCNQIGTPGGTFQF